MNLSSSLKIYSGGPGSGCRGPNCGRPSVGGTFSLAETIGRFPRKNENGTSKLFLDDCKRDASCVQLASALKDWSSDSERSSAISWTASRIIDGLPYFDQLDDYEEAKTILDGIAAAPEQEGEVWRGVHGHDRFLPQKEGDEIQIKGPKSFSWDRNTAEEFGGFNVLLHITGKIKGLNTAAFSYLPEEQEFITNGRFVCTGIRVSQGFKIYDLRQEGVLN